MIHLCQHNMPTPCHHCTLHTFRLKNNDTCIAEHTGCPPYKGQCTPSSFPSHLADKQCMTLGPCTLDTTHLFPFPFSSFTHTHCKVLVSITLSYKYFTPGLAEGHQNQGTIFTITSVCDRQHSFPHFSHAPTGSRAINNHQSAFPFFPLSYPSF